MKSISIIIIIVLFLSLTGFTQAINFSGTWTVTGETWISEKKVSNFTPKKIKLLQTTDRIVMESTYANFTLFDTLNFDVRILQSRGDFYVKKLKFLAWSDDQQSLTTNLEIFVIGNDDKMDHKQTDTYNMEEGKLVLDRKDVYFLYRKAWEVRAFYEKQNPIIK